MTATPPSPVRKSLISSHALEVVWGYFANLAPALAALVVGPLVARALGPVGRGQVAAVLAPLTLMEAVAGLGVPVAASYFASKGVPSTVILARYVPGCLVAACLTAGVGYLLFVSLGPSEQSLHVLFLWSLSALIVGAVLGVFRGLRNGQAEYSRSNASLWMGAVLRVSLVLAFFLSSALTVQVVVAITLGATLFGGLAVVRLSDIRAAASRRVSPTPGAMYRYAMSSWTGTLASSVAARLDQVLLVAMVSQRELGLYAVAVSLAEIPRSFFVVTSRSILTRVAGSRSFDLATRICRLSVLLVLPLMVLSIPLTPLTINVLFGMEFASSVLLAQILIAGSLVWGHGQNLSTVLAAVGLPGKAAACDTAMAVTSILLIVTLSPIYGAVGAAVSVLLAYGLGAVLKTWQVSRVTGVGALSLCLPTRDDFAWLKSRIRGAKSSNV